LDAAAGDAGLAPQAAVLRAQVGFDPGGAGVEAEVAVLMTNPYVTECRSWIEGSAGCKNGSPRSEVLLGGGALAVDNA
jgi:hypothetical protein